MDAARCIVTAWIRLPPTGPSLFDQLVAAVGEPPFETTDLDDVRDLQWVADSPNDALAKADRLKPFYDDPALILLKTASYHTGGPVDGVTIKDERRAPQSAPTLDPVPSAPAHPHGGDDRERLMRRIEQAGYRLNGWHDTIRDRDGGPVIVEATHRSTGQTHRVEVQAGRPAGEAQALEELARRLSLPNAESPDD